MTYDDLRRAYLAHMRATSRRESFKLIAEICGDVENLPAVPKDKWDKLIAAFKDATPDNGEGAPQDNAPEIDEDDGDTDETPVKSKAEKAPAAKKPMTREDYAQALSELYRPAFNRFNRRPRHG